MPEKKKVKRVRTLNQAIAGLPESERRKIAARTRQLVAEEMSLRDRRKVLGKTPVPRT